MRKQTTALHKILTGMLMLLPVVTVAQATFSDFMSGVVDLLNQTAVLIMGFALLAFIIGAIRFIATAGDDKSRAGGKQLMVWGTISLFIMVAVWGIVAIISDTFFGTT